MNGTILRKLSFLPDLKSPVNCDVSVGSNAIFNLSAKFYACSSIFLVISKLVYVGSTTDNCGGSLGSTGSNISMSCASPSPSCADTSSPSDFYITS